MSNPLFRTLQIGSLRYWGEITDITNTNIYSNVELDYGITTTLLTYDVDGFELNLQNSQFSLQFDDKVFEIVTKIVPGEIEVCV